MPLYLPAQVISSAVNRLVASKAQRGFTDFLILKRALKRANSETVPFSMKESNFTGAIHDVAGTQNAASGIDPAADNCDPFFKVFGIAQGVSRKMLTNGSADTLSGPNWQSIVKLAGQRPRRGGLRTGYKNHLEPLLLKREGDKPTVIDAAIWYFRHTDLEAKLQQASNTNQSVISMLTESFIEEVGLTPDEILHLFDSTATPSSTLSASDFQPAPAPAHIYLPSSRPQPEDTPRGIEQMASAFNSDATVDSVGMHLPEGVSARFIAALMSKKFLILTGLSGSGKTKLAQAFAQWITPSQVPADPFTPGTKIHGAQNTYTIIKANEGIVELSGEDGTLVALPMSIVEEWARYIQANNIPENTSARELRDKIEAQSKYISYLHRLESHYKPVAFALLSGLKTRTSADCYAIVPVGADWTSSEHILGYPDALRAPAAGQPGAYVTKTAMQLIQRATQPSRAAIPHFLILDEMNLSHVERYFADILSAIESCEPISLHDGSPRVDGNGNPVEATLRLPDNLFIIGTVNVDETTYMFSPKVLDRANVIEFVVTEGEIETFLSRPKSIDLSQLAGKGATYGEAFVGQSARQDITLDDVSAEVRNELGLVLKELFSALALVGAEFGYRPVYEISRFVYFHSCVSGLGWKVDTALDAAIMQKLLPKLHGSKTKLTPVLAALDKVITPSRFPISFAKIERMKQRLKQNGFTSYAEA